jgi:hypothetical protein
VIEVQSYEEDEDEDATIEFYGIILSIVHTPVTREVLECMCIR